VNAIVRTREPWIREERRVIRVVVLVNVINVVVGVDRRRRRRRCRRRREILFVQTFARWQRRRTRNVCAPFTHAYRRTVARAASSSRPRHQGGTHRGRAPAKIVRARAKITGLIMFHMGCQIKNSVFWGIFGIKKSKKTKWQLCVPYLF